MFALFAAVLAALLASGEAQNTSLTSRYSVWSSVIFSRTGERTPAILGTLPTTLTTLGAVQQENAGSFFRSRYLGDYTENGVGGAPIQGLSASMLDVNQVYINALDVQYAGASALAFLQGLYPPFTLGPDNTTEIDPGALNPTGLLANGTYIDAPLSGYQYPLIETSNFNDPEAIFLAGMFDCPAFDFAAENYDNNEATLQTMIDTLGVYQLVGPDLLSDVLPDYFWNYEYAYAIFDYINYHNMHNATFAEILSQPQYFNNATNTSYFSELQWLADQQQYGWLGDHYAINNITSTPFPSTSGSISTIAGNFLASKMLGQMQEAIKYQGEAYKLNILFGDFQPMMSLFSILDLPPLDSNFYGIPDFASVAAFELFSKESGDSVPAFPSEDELWVRFYFRNGTDDEDVYQAYPLFNLGPEYFEMQWLDFQDQMFGVLAGSVGDWCNQCGAVNFFCAYWNSSDALYPTSSSGSSHSGVSPVVGGVIGAVVTLAVAALIFGAVMLLGGVRFHRVERKKSEVGGYKGSHKLASDTDLVIPKGGAVVSGAAVDGPGSPRGGHERVGSWELKQNEAGLPNIAAPEQTAQRPSFEDDDHDDIGAAPFREGVKPKESV